MGYRIDIDTPTPPAVFAIQADARAEQALADALGIALPAAGSATFGTHDGRAFTVVRIGPNEWLLSTTTENETPLHQALLHVVQGLHCAVVVMSDAYSLFRLGGADRMQVMAQVVALDLDTLQTGSALRCGFGKASATIICHAAHIDIYIDATLAGYCDTLLRTCSGGTGDTPVRSSNAG